MKFNTPTDLIDGLLAARARGDIDAAIECYEAEAVVVVEPGRMATGREAIAKFTQDASTAPIRFGRRSIIESGAVALHFSHWRLSMANTSGCSDEVTGCTADVFHRQSDGAWLLAIDNAWGVQSAGQDDAEAYRPPVNL